MSKQNQRNLLLGIYTVSLFATALIGTAFCAYAAVLFVPALVPFIFVMTKKIIKSTKKHKINIA